MDHTVDTPTSETITTGPPRYTTIRDSAASRIGNERILRLHEGSGQQEPLPLILSSRGSWPADAALTGTVA